MIAARLGAAQKVAGTILLAAPALSGDSLMIQRSQILARNAGGNPATIAQETALRSAILQAAVNAQNADEARRTMTSKVERGLSDLPTADQALPSFARANWMTLVDVIASQWLWFKDWLTRDPMPDYRALRSPVLAIVGEKDQQVPPALTTDRLRAALGSEAVRVLPSLNHLMQTATTGSPAEYATLREAMSPMAIASIIAWIGMQR